MCTDGAAHPPPAAARRGHVRANATLDVAHNKQHVMWPGVAGSGQVEEPEWRDKPIEGID